MAIDLHSLLIQDLSLEPQACANRVVVVTGAGRGIGLQIARAFAFLGAKVVLAELSELGQAVEEQIRSEGGLALYIQTDVSRPESISRLAQLTHERYGPVDVLVNNAISIHQAAVTELPLEVWDQIIAVNLRGAFLTCKIFLPDMLARKSGTILNLVSTDAMPGLSAYIASKQGLTGFSQSLALETGPAGVRVIPFGPGMVDTPGIRSVAEGLAPRLGLKTEQFLNMSLHSAYAGLMPPEHAGAAAVYLTLRLADEFQGQLVNGYEVLERAGFLHTFPIDSQAADESQATGSPEPQPSLIEDLAKQLIQILAETEAEFNKLPGFIRPMARNGFKSKAGQSLPDWRRLLEDLALHGRAAVRADLPARLDKLANYYRDVPKETARFTRDAEMLRQTADLCSQRIGVIQNLKNAL